MKSSVAAAGVAIAGTIAGIGSLGLSHDFSTTTSSSSPVPLNGVQAVRMFTYISSCIWGDSNTNKNKNGNRNNGNQNGNQNMDKLNCELIQRDNQWVEVKTSEKKPGTPQVQLYKGPDKEVQW
jgi:hypothetical protein